MTTWFLQGGALLDLHLLLTCCVALIYIYTNLSISNIKEIFHGLGLPRIRKYMDDNTDVRFGWAGHSLISTSYSLVARLGDVRSV